MRTPSFTHRSSIAAIVAACVVACVVPSYAEPRRAAASTVEPAAPAPTPAPRPTPGTPDEAAQLAERERQAANKQDQSLAGFEAGARISATTLIIVLLLVIILVLLL